MPTLTGTNLNDNIIGSDTDDDIFGLAGNDQLTGNAGNDVIVGGSGEDILTGGSGLDTLTGGDDVDRFRDTAAGLNGDHITDFLPGDRIQITDLNLATANIGVVGSTITYNGGSVTVDNLGPGRLIVRAVQTGGIEIRLQSIPQNDFNGDGRSDVLWRSDAGEMANWLGTASGGFVNNGANAWFTNVPSSWQVISTGDFNGDGRSDLLWRSGAGEMTNWLGTANGGFVNNGANFWNTNLPSSWQVVGTGDYNGDGRDDLMWQSTSGEFSNWLGTASGGFTNNGANAWGVGPASWHIVGSGDFNGDGRDDILWRSDAGELTNWLGQANGGFVNNGANAWFSNVPSSWQVVGTGDFNGDGLDDLMWRSTSGEFVNWLGQANGGFVNNGANSWGVAPANWHIEGIGDYNGDGRDDLLWRSDAGEFSNWLGTASGGFTNNGANSWGVGPASWHIQPDNILI
jgi:hypothetical protein